MIFLITQFT